MLKAVPILRTARGQRSAVHQVVVHAHIKEIELGSLHHFALERLGTACRCIIVSRDKFNRRIDNVGGTNSTVECLYIFDFLKMLWNKQLF